MVRYGKPRESMPWVSQDVGEVSKDMWFGVGLVGKEWSMVVMNGKVSMSNW
jgi:hypothetical protein